MIDIMSVLFDALSHLDGSQISRTVGSNLFARGDQVRFLYLVDSGWVQLSRYDEEGKPAIMQRAGPGMVLAESSIFAAAYHCDGIVIANAVLRQVDIGRVRSEMTASSLLLDALARHLAREVQRTRLRVEILCRRTVKDRLSAWLSFNDGVLPPAGRIRSVADDIGVSPEALYRELSKRRGIAGTRRSEARKPSG